MNPKPEKLLGTSEFYNILIVESESIVALDLQNKLENFGCYVCAIATSGDEAIQKTIEHNPDLVLLNIRTEGNIDGMEAARYIHKNLELPIVFLTTYADRDTLSANKIDSLASLLKPFSEKELQVIIDLTIYRHRKEKNLKENHQWLATVLKSIGEAVITVDSNGKITFMNPIAEAMTAWKQEDAIGRDGTEVFHIVNFENRTPLDNPLSKALQKKLVAVKPENTILIAKNGAKVPIDRSVAPIKDNKGNIIGAVLVFQDITIAKRTEEERKRLLQEVQQLNSDLERQVQERTTQLQQSLGFEAVLKRITDKVRDSLDESQILQVAVRELALMLNVDTCNTALYNLEEDTATIYYEHTTLKRSSQNRIIKMADFPEIYNPLLQGQCFQFCSYTKPVKEQVAKLACPIFDDKGVLGDLWLLHRKDRGFNSLEIRLVQQVANQCAIAIRQARLYQTSQAQVKELEKLNQLKDDFLSTVSHELRTPIANMKMAIKMLNLVPTNNRSQRYLQILAAECDREAELINDLLDLQRLEAVSYPTFLPQAVSLQKWMPTVIEAFQSRMQERQLLLTVDIPPELPQIVSDLSSLERIVAELLNNACKYTPPKEQITLSARSEPGKIELKVSNSGTEIPESELNRIFDKFYRIPSADRWKQGGTGLGLALVQRLVEHLGGNIQVESASGKTTFTLTLPTPLKNSETG